MISYNIIETMKTKLFCVLLLILGAAVATNSTAALSANASESNPFYVIESTIVRTPTRWTMQLGNHHNPGPDPHNQELATGWLELESYDANVLHMKINDKNGNRWEAPLLNPEPRKHYRPATLENMGLTLTYDPFSIKITSSKVGETLVNTHPDAMGSMKYFDKFIEYGLWYPNYRIFGLGERVTEKFELCAGRADCTYTMFNKDQVSPLDIGAPPGGQNVYGSQPFYMVQTKSNMFFGVLFLNSNDQDIVIVKRNGGPANVYHKTIGGIIDMYFIYIGTAEFVTQKYHSLIGRPYLPPFWSLGFHQCRYGWNTLNRVKDVVAKFEQYDLPLEVVWADIDYMRDYIDFTVDPTRYSGMKEFVSELHKKKMRWVPIIDAGLKYDLSDPFYQKGEANNAFIKSAWTKKTLIGKVWPGPAVFPDWYTPYMTNLWHEGLSTLYSIAEFDGIWIDMNECSSECDGECTSKCDSRCPPPVSGDPFLAARRLLNDNTSDSHDPHEFDNLPYYPGWKDPAIKTLSSTGYHRGSNDYEEKNLKEYNVHDLFALYEAKATHTFFTEVQKRRAFVLTRANFIGSGMFTSLWLGDNWARWEYMRYSIIGMYNYQMFGMPLVGADMCGFMEDTNEELCARWMQMGAFYPFSRNHNDIHAKDQEPYVFGDRVATATRNALRQKYSILWYYYTKLAEVSMNGGTLMRPLFFEFPGDEKAYSKAEYTFMIGPSLLVAPVLYPGAMLTYPYVTNENWFDLFWRVRQYTYDPSATEGKELSLPGGFEYVSVLMRGGSIIPFQDAMGSKVRRTEALKNLPMELMVGPDHNGDATGTLFVDYNDALASIEKKEYRYTKFSFSMKQAKLQIEMINDYDKHYPFEKFTKITLLGVEAWKDHRKMCVVDKSGNKLLVTGSYNTQQGALYFTKQNSGLYWSQIKYLDFDQSANCGA